MNTQTTPRRHPLVRMVRFILPILIITGGIAVAKYLYATKPEARRGRAQVEAPLVETMTVRPLDHRVTLSAMGTVIPARSMMLKSRVGGFVLEKSHRLIPGGIFKKGDVMIQLEKTDFLLDIAQKKAALARLKASLRLEMGKQAVAREEVRILRKNAVNTVTHADLALREPQLAQIKADIAAAETELTRVELALERSLIRAPFNCIVMSVNVETGSQISTQESLASLSGTDVYWIKAALPADQLQWVRIPFAKKGTGSAAVITRENAPLREGHVIRLLGELVPETRLATVLIAVDDPLGLQRQNTPPLLLNSYVTVDIQGKSLSGMSALPRRVIRDGNTLWCVAENRLQIKTVTPVWQDVDYLYAHGGITPDDQIIVSDLASPVPGMALMVQTDVPGIAREKIKSSSPSASPATRADAATHGDSVQ